MMRMLHQIQSDIHVKEELVTHLEKSEMQYTFMRKKFEEQLAMQQQAMSELQRERDTALRRATPNYIGRPDPAAQLKDKQQLLEVRHAYEAKMKRLFAETQELRRKYTQTARTMQSTRNQNESMLRTLKVNVETLKVEKRRMIKRMKQDAERVKEQLTAQERQIQLLRRKQAEVSIAKKRLEREHESQRRTLKRRDEEILMSNEQLKHLVNVLKKAVREGGVLDERLLNKVTGVLGGRFAIMSRGRSAFAAARRLNSKAPKRHNPIPIQVRVAKKKELLDIALYKYIEGKQALVEMEQLLFKRESLAEEKAELTAEREQLLASERLRAMENDDEVDTSATEYLDERIELVSAEISYLSARIKAIQHDAASDMITDPASAEAAQRHRMTKHVTFADEIIAPTGKDGWTDIDTLEDQFSLPYNAGPEMAYDTTIQLIKTLEADESRKLTQALVEDVMALRMDEFGRQITVQTLEKTVQDLRRTLLIMKRAAVSTSVKNEHQIQKLLSNGNVSNEDDATALRMKIEASMNMGNTIFDKIYENGIRGAIMSPEMLGDQTSSSNGSPILGDDLGLHSPPLMSPTRRSGTFSLEMRHNHLRSPTPSPDRLLAMAQKHMRPDADLGIINANDFTRYAADKDSSTSSIRSNHLRRSSITSDSSLQSWSNATSPARRRAQSLQQQPIISSSRRRPSFRELSHGGANRESLDMMSPPSPYATMSYQRNLRRAPSATSPSHSMASNTSNERAMTPNGTVFERLAQVHTQSSQAKMAHRYSSSSVDELKSRWNEYERSSSAMSGSYYDGFQ